MGIMEEPRAYVGRKARFHRLICAASPILMGQKRRKPSKSPPENGGRLNRSPNRFSTFAGQRAWRAERLA